MQHGYNSSSNSNSSSIGSISSSSSDSDRRMTMEGGDLEADADSLSCRQSGLSSNDHLENDGPKLVLHFILLIPLSNIFMHFVLDSGVTNVVRNIIQ